VHGTSTRKVDDLVRARGVDAGISKSEVSRICAELDAEVAAVRSRSLAHTAFPYLFVDATYRKARPWDQRSRSHSPRGWLRCRVRPAGASVGPAKVGSPGGHLGQAIST
jgi:Transposase, Mutator family